MECAYYFLMPLPISFADANSAKPVIHGAPDTGDIRNFPTALPE